MNRIREKTGTVLSCPSGLSCQKLLTTLFGETDIIAEREIFFAVHTNGRRKTAAESKTSRSACELRLVLLP